MIVIISRLDMIVIISRLSRSISLVVRYGSYNIEVVRGGSILLPSTSFHVPCCSSMVDINYPPCTGWLLICGSLVPHGWISISALHWAFIDMLLSRIWVSRIWVWVYNRINIFIYYLFFVFVRLVVGSRNPMRIPDNKLTKHKTIMNESIFKKYKVGG